MASEAQKGVLASRARLRRPNEPAEPMARRRDRRANPLRPLRKPHFSGELRILVNERAAGRGRTLLGARQNRQADSIAGRDRQEMGEDGGLFAVGQICNDEAIAGERLQVEDVGAGLDVRDERIGVCVEVGAAHNKTLRAQLANHVAAAGAGLEDRAFDLDRTAERGIIQPASMVKYSSWSKRLKRLGATSQRLPASLRLRAANLFSAALPLISSRLLATTGRWHARARQTPP